MRAYPFQVFGGNGKSPEVMPQGRSRRNPADHRSQPRALTRTLRWSPSPRFVDELQKRLHFRVDRRYVFGDNALDEIPNLLKRIAPAPHFFMHSLASLTMNFHLSWPFDTPVSATLATIIEDTRLFSYETLLRFEHWFVSARLGANQSLWPPFRQPRLKQTDQSLRAYGLLNAVLSFGAAASRQV